MRRTEFTVSRSELQRLAVDSLEGWLSVLNAAVPEWLAPLLVWIATHKTSLSMAGQQLTGVPGAERVRQVMHACLPTPEHLLRCFQQSVTDQVPKRLRKRPWLLAIDLHDRPYYGADQACLRRGQAKRGTKRFFSYATCCLVGTNQRYTIAVVPVSAGAKLEEVIDQLLDQIRAQGWKIRGLLLDRGFYSAPVIARLQARRVPFAMPMIRRGKQGRTPQQDTGTQGFFRRGCEGHFTYTWVARGKPSRGGPTVTVNVACAPPKDRRRRPWVYVYWGLRWSLSFLNKAYRQRFGIESSYRQLGQALASTTSRKATYRLLLVLLALLLRNIWVWYRAKHRSPLRLLSILQKLAQALTQLLDPQTPPTHKSIQNITLRMEA